MVANVCSKLNLNKVSLGDMERVGNDEAANEITRNTELKRKDCNLPLKPELKSDWSERSLHNCRDTIEAGDLHRFVTSLIESELPGTSPCSMKDTGLAIGELTVGNFRGMNSVLVSSPSSSISRQDQWQHLHQLASGSGLKALHGDSVSHDKDKSVLRIREQYTKMNSNIENPNFLSKKRIDQKPEEFSPYIRAKDSMIMSSNKLPIGSSTQLKTLSANGFSQFFVKRTLKGKGVISSIAEAGRGFGSPVVDWNDDKSGHLTKVTSDSLLKSSFNNNLQSSHGVNRPVPECFDDGICLREWLKPGCPKRERVESLHIFRQIVELVDAAQSRGLALQDLRTSYFYLYPSKRVIYNGSFIKRDTESAASQVLNKKRPLEQHMEDHFSSGAKHQKIGQDLKSLTHQPQFTSSCSYRTNKPNENDFYVNGSQACEFFDVSPSTTLGQQSFSANAKLEMKWYSSPEELKDSCFSLSSNIYGLGVLLFELLCHFESSEVRSAVMSNLRHRILPSKFLSENPKEAGFCLWLLHPDPSSRPTTREILHSELTYSVQELHSQDDLSISIDEDEADSEILVHFLVSLKEQKQKHASTLVKNIRCLEEDIKEVEERYMRRTSSVFSMPHKENHNARKQSSDFEGSVTSISPSQSFSMLNTNEGRLMRNINQLENAYFSIRSQIRLTEASPAGRSDEDLFMNRYRWTEVQNKNESNKIQKSVDHLGNFFEGLCKFACYNKFEVRGTLRNGDLLNSPNVICSLSFDRDEEYIAAAGVSKRIKIFEYKSLLSDSIDVHYPVVEMSNKSKLSCVCWNNYIKNYLASTDYDGVVQIWDAGTGQGISRYTEHSKRAWSVDFSQVDPTRFVSGSDDCSVKLWSINEQNSAFTIVNPANVCCVQFSAFSTHLLAFGSADYKVYCYDLRNTRSPWCTLSGHEKAVSYVKFLDSETLVSASTDNTLKLWDLKRTSPTGLSSGACSLTFRGHTNEKNFVGLSVLDGYIACGSETNEVYSYYRSLPMPITSHKFGSTDPISGHEIGDDNGQFVSSVCWRQKSNMVVAANSSGSIKLLQMVQ